MNLTTRSRAGLPAAIGAMAALALLAACTGAGPDSAKGKATASGRDKEAKAGKLSVIDEMLQSSWKAAKVKPSAGATDAEFLRRAYLDLLGRIPNVEEASSFLDAKDAGKRTKLVEHLLAHPDFAKNFGNEWSIILVGRKPAGRDVDKNALSSWLRREVTAGRPWNEMAYRAHHGQGRQQGQRRGQLPDGPPGRRRGQPHQPHDPRVPRPADPVHPVSRPSVEQLEASRFLEHQRLLTRA